MKLTSLTIGWSLNMKVFHFGLMTGLTPSFHCFVVYKHMMNDSNSTTFRNVVSVTCLKIVILLS
jgi:hypothetical protein